MFGLVLMILMNLNTGNPPEINLFSVSLTQNHFTLIKNASSDGYQGWASENIDGRHFFGMAWTDRNSEDFNTVANTLFTLFGGELKQHSGGDGIYFVYGDGYSLFFFSEEIPESQTGIRISVGTMVAIFGRFY